jgi:glycerol-3-phosphate acyltransferase PlsY
MLSFLIIVGAYLLGSIPFGYLLVKAGQGADVRESGSGGTGATNVSRRAGKLAGLLTLLLDALKGTIAVLLARWLATPDFGINWTVSAAAIAVIMGHIFPVWLGFRGGKGVATGLGAFLGLFPLAVVCALVIFIPIVALTRYVSLGSISAAAAMPLFLLFFLRQDRFTNVRGPLLTAALSGGALIIFMHRENIRRLFNGTENKFR